MWWLLTREVMRLRGSISREVPWEIMPDLYFYRDPNEEVIILVHWLLNHIIISRAFGKVWFRRSTISGLDLVWFSSLSSKCLCIFDFYGGMYTHLACPVKKESLLCCTLSVYLFVCPVPEPKALGSPYVTWQLPISCIICWLVLISEGRDPVWHWHRQYDCWSSSSRLRVVNHNSSAMKQCLHLQSVAEISRHSVLSGDRIRQCGTSSGWMWTPFTTVWQHRPRVDCFLGWQRQWSDTRVEREATLMFAHIMYLNQTISLRHWPTRNVGTEPEMSGARFSKNLKIFLSFS